jgi:hypothetical protein
MVRLGPTEMSAAKSLSGGKRTSSKQASRHLPGWRTARCSEQLSARTPEVNAELDNRGCAIGPRWVAKAAEVRAVMFGSVIHVVRLILRYDLRLAGTASRSWC